MRTEKTKINSTNKGTLIKPKKYSYTAGFKQFVHTHWPHRTGYSSFFKAGSEHNDQGGPNLLDMVLSIELRSSHSPS
jgi:hypothetical protein